MKENSPVHQLGNFVDRPWGVSEIGGTGPRPYSSSTFLHRLEDQKVQLHADPTEQVAVWALSASLERTLIEPFRADYQNLIAQAKHPLTASQ
jgi:hypothetical protein